MARLAVALLIVAIAAGVALVLRRRNGTDPPTQLQHHTPLQLDRSDFVRPDAPWLVVAFTSSTCHTCADTVAKAKVLATSAVAFEEVEFTAHADRHRRYAIDAVPTLVLADRAGVVQASFVGRVTATDLWAAVAEAREPGSRPPGGCERHGRPDEPGS